LIGGCCGRRGGARVPGGRRRLGLAGAALILRDRPAVPGPGGGGARHGGALATVLAGLAVVLAGRAVTAAGGERRRCARRP
jgi:hypothetical protein